MKNQANMSPLKVNNSTVKDLSDSEEGEISNNKIKKWQEWPTKLKRTYISNWLNSKKIEINNYMNIKRIQINGWVK